MSASANPEGLPPPLSAVYKTLRDAIGTGNFSLVREILQMNPAINIDDEPEDGFLPLIEAVQARQLNVAGDLIELSGANVQRTRASDGCNALMVAVKQADYLMGKRLIALGASVHGQDSRGYTALHHAVRASCVSCIWLLLEHGADITVRSNNDAGAGAEEDHEPFENAVTPYELALSAHLDDVPEFLQRFGTPQASNGVVVVEYILPELLRAITAGNVPLVIVLGLWPGLDVNRSRPREWREVPLLSAVSQFRHTAAIALVEMCGATEARFVPDHQCTMLMVACGFFLPELYFPPERDIPSSALTTIRLALNRNEDVNYRNPAGETALRCAAMKLQLPEAVRLLLERGADPSIRNGQGQTVEQELAARQNDLDKNETEILEMLRKHAGSTAPVAREPLEDLKCVLQ